MPSNWNHRLKHNQKKLREGDIDQVAEVVRDLNAYSKEHGLSTGERNMLMKARQILVSEIALVRELNVREAETLLERSPRGRRRRDIAAAAYRRRPGARRWNRQPYGPSQAVYRPAGPSRTPPHPARLRERPEHKPHIRRGRRGEDRRASPSEAGIRKYTGVRRSPARPAPSLPAVGSGCAAKKTRPVVLIHDGSRCLVTTDLIERVVEAARGAVDGVIPTVPRLGHHQSRGERLRSGDPRPEQAARHQTPQAFRLGLLRRIYAFLRRLRLRAATDDASLVENEGGSRRDRGGRKDQRKAHLAGGPRSGRGDPDVSRRGAALSFRVGLGVDVHAFAGLEENSRLILGGVENPLRERARPVTLTPTSWPTP